MLWALVTAFGLVSALKRATERTTERYCARRRRRMRRGLAREQAARSAREQDATATAAQVPGIIAFPAPTLVPDWPPNLQPHLASRGGGAPVDAVAGGAIPFPRAAGGRGRN
jgi:hypothetical protein